MRKKRIREYEGREEMRRRRRRGKSEEEEDRGSRKCKTSRERRR